MKMLSLASLTVLAAMALHPSARGDEPAALQANPLTPQIQAMLAELLKAADIDPASPPQPTPAPAASTTSPNATGPAPAPSNPSATKMIPSSNALHTGSLRTGHLGSSGSLTGAARMSNDEWRQLFPQRK
jgi:hypothetical protein